MQMQTQMQRIIAATCFQIRDGRSGKPEVQLLVRRGGTSAGGPSTYSFLCAEFVQEKTIRVTDFSPLAKGILSNAGIIIPKRSKHPPDFISGWHSCPFLGVHRYLIFLFLRWSMPQKGLLNGNLWVSASELANCQPVQEVLQYIAKIDPQSCEILRPLLCEKEER